ncbi:MAG: type VI secretion system baseplate subunit TssG [Bryobacteraceae bacterium]|jgi:type VI secretion system protein ImpH
MATPGRRQDPPVESQRPRFAELEQVLREQPFGFDFFQAVRLLGRILTDRQPVGQFSNPRTEVVRFGTGADFGFPPSQIASLDWPENEQPLMRVNFMGLTGPHGVLPLYYSALVRERLRARDSAIREFLDIFNHRILSLFYQAWEKFHFTVSYEKGDDDRLSPHLLDLLGLGTAGLADRQQVSDEALVFRCGLLAPLTRSAAALRLLLMDYFEVPVEIEQFVGAWHSLERDTQCRFSETASYSEQLGMGAVVGDEIWDQQSTVRIRLGPLTLEQYRDFLPDGSAHAPLRALVRFFAGNELDFEAQLVLRKEEAPACELGSEGEAGPRLGWLTWAKTAPMAENPADGILRI